jgi:prophage regulatory protein
MQTVIRLGDAARRLGVSRSGLYGIKQRDPSFPQKINIGVRAVGFIEQDLEGWINSKKGDQQCLTQ